MGTSLPSYGQTHSALGSQQKPALSAPCKATSQQQYVLYKYKLSTRLFPLLRGVVVWRSVACRDWGSLCAGSIVQAQWTCSSVAVCGCGERFQKRVWTFTTVCVIELFPAVECDRKQFRVIDSGLSLPSHPVDEHAHTHTHRMTHTHTHTHTQ